MALIISDVKHNPVPRRLLDDEKKVIRSAVQSPVVAQYEEGIKQEFDEPGVYANYPLAGSLIADHEVSETAVEYQDNQYINGSQRDLLQQSIQEKREHDEQRIQAAIDDGYKQGYEKGHDEAMQAVMDDMQVEMDGLAGLSASMLQAMQEQIAGMESIALEIVLESVNKVFGSAMLDRDVAISVIRKVIEQTQNRADLTVYLSHRDFAYLEKNNIELIESKPGDKIRIVADDRVELGGCILESDAGSVDGRIETQISHLREIIMAASTNNDVSGDKP